MVMVSILTLGRLIVKIVVTKRIVKFFILFSFIYVTPCVILLCHIVDNPLFFPFQVYFVFIVLWFIGNCNLLLCIVIKYMYYGTGRQIRTQIPVCRVNTIFPVSILMYAIFPVMYAIFHVMYAAYTTTNLPLHDVWPGKHSALSAFYCCILYISTWCMFLD